MKLDKVTQLQHAKDIVVKDSLVGDYKEAWHIEAVLEVLRQFASDHFPTIDKAVHFISRKTGLKAAKLSNMVMGEIYNQEKVKNGLEQSTPAPNPTTEGNVSSLFASDGLSLLPEGGGLVELANGRLYSSTISSTRKLNAGFAIVPNEAPETGTPYAEGCSQINKLITGSSFGRHTSYTRWCAVYKFQPRDGIKDVLDLLAGENIDTVVSRRFKADFPDLVADIPVKEVTVINVVADPPPAATPSLADALTSNKIKPGQIPYDGILESFHEICISLPRLTRLSDSQRKEIQRCWKNGMTLEDFNSFFAKTEASDYLSGRSGKWTICSLGWLLAPRNMMKVLDGRYDNDRFVVAPCYSVTVPSAEESVKEVLLTESSKAVVSVLAGAPAPELDAQKVVDRITRNVVIQFIPDDTTQFGFKTYLPFEVDDFEEMQNALVSKLSEAVESLVRATADMVRTEAAIHTNEQVAQIEQKLEKLQLELDAKTAELESRDGEVHFCRGVNIRLGMGGATVNEIMLADRVGNEPDYFREFPGKRLSIRVLE